MARDRAKINTGIWGDKDWKSLTMAEQWLYTTILTRPDLNHVGVGDWRPRRLSKLAVGISAEQVEEAAEGLQAKLFILVDDESEEVLIRSFLKHDGVLQNPNLGASIKSAYDSVVSSMLQEVVVHELHKLSERDPDLPAFTSVKSKAHLAALMRMPAAPITDHVNAVPHSKNAVPEVPQRRSEPETTPFGSGDPSSTTTTTTATTTSSYEDPEEYPEALELIIEEPQGPTEDDLFKAFWAEYPSKAGRKPAREKFTVALRRASAQEIISGAHRYNVDPNREQAYTKHAATWLHNDGWEDPPLPPRQPAGKQTAIDREHQVHAERAARIRQLQNGGAGWQPKRMEE
ncbi:hypothetical protein ACHABQ_03000 [Nesterenkonia aurantiaca]|uniref:hypothetical protein n=1 Tax=Nesterenkonia aurantiaca TaxID=1436010 RepID=UPI003EE6A8F8